MSATCQYRSLRRVPFTAERGNRPAREWPTNESPSTMTSKSRFRRIGLVTDWRHVARGPSTARFRRLAGVSPQSYRNTFRERIAG